MNVKCFQLMRHIFCYVKFVLISNAKTQARKGLILYNSANEINALNKHVYAHHCMIAKIFEKKVNLLLKKPYEKQRAKKRHHVNGTIISKVFCSQRIL